jgi:predicted small metal-binding protein
MPGKEYKELSCRYVGMDCDFLVRAETEDEVLNLDWRAFSPRA